ncbi:MAG: FecR domain-containing protein [bacterium]
MRIGKKEFLVALNAMYIALLIGTLVMKGNVSSETTPGWYLQIEEICTPSYGISCGEVCIVCGKVVIIRPKIAHSCWARRDLSLFNSDIISTQENGRMRFSFIDGSLVTLASMTELEITRNILDRAAETRSLFINMRSGKARFMVCKLEDFAFSDVIVKTSTAIVVGIGSDFVVEVDDAFTRVTALEDTLLKIIGLADLEMEPALLSDFERTMIEHGRLPAEAETVSQEEIEQMLKEFEFAEELSVRRRVRKDTKQYEGIVVSEGALLLPEMRKEPGEFEFHESSGLIEEPSELKDRIFNEICEDKIRGNVPNFPQPPSIGQFD